MDSNVQLEENQLLMDTPVPEEQIEAHLEKSEETEAPQSDPQENQPDSGDLPETETPFNDEGPEISTDQQEPASKGRRGSMFEEIKSIKATNSEQSLAALPNASKISIAGSRTRGFQAGLEKIFRHDLSTDNLYENQKPLRRPKLIYENTYQLEPKKRFNLWTVKSIISKVLDEQCKDLKYNANTCTEKAMELAEKIRGQVLQLDYERYKILSYVIISQQGRQGMFTGFRVLWDSARDSYASETFENHYVAVTAVVYGVYFE